MEIPEDIIDQINENLAEFLHTTLQDSLLNNPQLELLKVVYRNGALEMYKFLKDRESE